MRQALLRAGARDAVEFRETFSSSCGPTALSEWRDVPKLSPWAPLIMTHPVRPKMIRSARNTAPQAQQGLGCCTDTWSAAHAALAWDRQRLESHALIGVDWVVEGGSTVVHAL